MPKNKLPLVTIIIPTYNREWIIGETIESALNQTYPNIEIVIWDNCSTDSTYSIVQGYAKSDSRIIFFKNNENLWPVKNWKKCLNKATWYYVKFLWSDDLISNNFIEKTLDLFDNNTAFVYTKTEIFFSNWLKINSYIQKQQVISSNTFISKSILWEWNFPVSPWCAIFRTSDVKESLLIEIPNNDNLIFNKFWAWNDLLIFLKIAFKYKHIKYVNETLSFFRAHKNSISCSNNIELYYDWARKSMLDIINDKDLEIKFKSKLFLYKVFHENYVNIYNDTNSKISISYLLKRIFRYIMFYIFFK